MNIRNRILKRQFKWTNYAPNYTVYSVKWTFHKADDDPVPTIPHGHGVYKKKVLKLFIWDGEVLRLSGKKWVHEGWASKRELNVLYADPIMATFVEEA